MLSPTTSRKGIVMAGAGEAFVVAPAEGRSIDLGAFAMTVKASSEETGGAFSLLEAEEPPGFGPPLHVHHDAAEAFYVLEGEYVMFLDDRAVSCPAGSFIFIPQGMRHGFKVGPAPSRKLNFYFPAAMIGYFDELSAAIGRGEIDEGAFDDVARRYSMEIVGPVPESYV
jgi:mannose-6-phosphate isomerase-like protein (cupin superfamily)